jgi:hypothetical protein
VQRPNLGNVQLVKQNDHDRNYRYGRIGEQVSFAKKYFCPHQKVYSRGCAGSVGAAIPPAGSDLAVLSQNINPARGGSRALQC